MFRNDNEEERKHAAVVKKILIACIVYASVATLHLLFWESIPFPQQDIFGMQDVPHAEPYPKRGEAVILFAIVFLMFWFRNAIARAAIATKEGIQWGKISRRFFK